MGRRGFSLLEVMVVVVIVGILAVIAIPSYTGHVKKVRRSEAVNGLQTIALYQERYRAEHGAYTSLATLSAAYPNTFSSDFYAFTATSTGSGQNFTAIATPAGVHAPDNDSSNQNIVFCIRDDGTCGRWVGGACTANQDLWTTLRP